MNQKSFLLKYISFLEQEVMADPQSMKATKHIHFWLYELSSQMAAFDLEFLCDFLFQQKQIKIDPQSSSLSQAVKTKAMHPLHLSAIMEYFVEAWGFKSEVLKLQDGAWLRIKKDQDISYVHIQNGQIYKTPEEMAKIVNHPPTWSPHQDQLAEISQAELIQMIQQYFKTQSKDPHIGVKLSQLTQQFVEVLKLDTYQSGQSFPHMNG